MALQTPFAAIRTPLYAIVRFVAGILFAFHGAQKLFGWFGGQRVELASQLGLAGLIELLGGLAIALGFLTTLAAAGSALEMIAAYLIAHAPRGLLPIQNQGELALLYLLIFVLILIEGGGRWSVDSLLCTPKQAKS